MAAPPEPRYFQASNPDTGNRPDAGKKCFRKADMHSDNIPYRPVMVRGQDPPLRISGHHINGVIGKKDILRNRQVVCQPVHPEQFGMLFKRLGDPFSMGFIFCQIRRADGQIEQGSVKWTTQINKIKSRKR